MVLEGGSGEVINSDHQSTMRLRDRKSSSGVLAVLGDITNVRSASVDPTAASKVVVRTRVSSNLLLDL